MQGDELVFQVSMHGNLGHGIIFIYLIGEPASFNRAFKMPFQDHVKEKLKLVQNFLHVDAQDQLTTLEEKMKSSEISMVCDLISK